MRLVWKRRAGLVNGLEYRNIVKDKARLLGLASLGWLVVQVRDETSFGDSSRKKLESFSNLADL